MSEIRELAKREIEFHDEFKLAAGSHNQRAIAEYILATTRDDDGEVIDKEWAKKMCREFCGLEIYFTGSDYEIILFRQVIKNTYSRDIFTTKGQLRKLVEALEGK